MPKNNTYTCEPPLGSYQDICAVIGKPYISTDPKLSATKMCQFDLKTAMEALWYEIPMSGVVQQ